MVTSSLRPPGQLDGSPTSAQAWLERMNTTEMIGQMSQIEINMLLQDSPGKKRLDPDKVHHYIGQVGVGSVLNTVTGETWTAQDYREAMIMIQQVARQHQRPPVIWGLDSVHGANYVYNATLTPQPINIAASFNRTVAELAGRIASRDTRAAGINWLFSPLLGLSLEPRWSRVYETF